MKKKKYLVTGGAGFLGSHLCGRLLEEGNEVVCLDNLSTGRIKNISGFLENNRFEFREHDVTDPLFVQVDAIYNLASPASPVHYQADPIKTTKTSVIGALNMLELARQLNIPVLQASTSEVYGDPEVHPQPETYRGNVNPIGPRACYDEGKRCAETLFFDYFREYQVPIKVMRIFNTYGPNMDPQDGRVVSNFIIQALKGEPITIYGTGSQTRSFCYVDDLIDGMMRLMNTEDTFTGPVNIGNPHEFTISDLAETVIQLTKSSSAIKNMPLPQDDPLQRKPVIEVAKTHLDWQPYIDLETGLKSTISYFRKELERNEAANI